MKKLLLLTFLSTLGLFAFAQSTSSTTTNWDIVADTGHPLTKTTTKGSTISFADNKQWRMTTPYGQFQATWTWLDGRMLLAGVAYDVEVEGEEKMTITQSDTGRKWQLQRRELLANNGIVPPATELGPLRLDGCYYSEDKLTIPTSYNYFRFYEDGTLLKVETIIPPTEIATYLNRAYMSNDADDRAELVPEAVEINEDQVIYDFTTPIKTDENGEVIVTRNDNYTFTPTQDGLQLHEESQWSNSRRAWQKDDELSFLPLTLGTWSGKPLSAGSIGCADEWLILPTIPESERIAKVVEEMPRFPGCEDERNADKRKMCAQQELLKFIYKNIKYPTVARAEEIEGTNVVTFVVEKDGSITNPRIVRAIGGGCEEETLRVVNLMNEQGMTWTPGQQDGRPARVQFNLPIKYKLR